MPYPEDDLLPISALQHLAFCERQWGLIHLEQVWSENLLTAEGRVLHERAHEAASELRGGVLTARAVRLRSLRLGLTGVADVVEFHRVAPASEAFSADGTALPEPSPESSPKSPPAVPLPGRRGLWRPLPVEYKHGRPKANRCDEIQLCAQALCLEEMLGVSIDAGALFYGQTRRRSDVAFDPALREATESLATRMHALHAAGVTPPGCFAKKCASCSLLEVCRPQAIQSSHSAVRYLDRQLGELEREEP